MRVIQSQEKEGQMPIMLATYSRNKIIVMILKEKEKEKKYKH